MNMKRCKKIMACLMGIVIFVGLIPKMDVEAKAYNEFEYEIMYNGEVEITKYNGDIGNVSIPSKIDGINVT